MTTKKVNPAKLEKLVKDATKNTDWGPSSTEMWLIADLSNDENVFTKNGVKMNNSCIIMQAIWSRLQENKGWRYIYKAVVLLESLLKLGNRNLLILSRKDLSPLLNLAEYKDDKEKKDLGRKIREKIPEVLALINDHSLYEEKRKEALLVRQRTEEVASSPKASNKKNSNILFSHSMILEPATVAVEQQHENIIKTTVLATENEEEIMRESKNVKSGDKNDSKSPKDDENKKEDGDDSANINSNQKSDCFNDLLFQEEQQRENSESPVFSIQPIRDLEDPWSKDNLAEEPNQNDSVAKFDHGGNLFSDILTEPKSGHFDNGVSVSDKSVVDFSSKFSSLINENSGSGIDTTPHSSDCNVEKNTKYTTNGQAFLGEHARLVNFDQLISSEDGKRNLVPHFQNPFFSNLDSSKNSHQQPVQIASSNVLPEIRRSESLSNPFDAFDDVRGAHGDTKSANCSISMNSNRAATALSSINPQQHARTGQDFFDKFAATNRKFQSLNMGGTDVRQGGDPFSMTTMNIHQQDESRGHSPWKNRTSEWIPMHDPFQSDTQIQSRFHSNSAPVDPFLFSGEDVQIKNGVNALPFSFPPTVVEEKLNFVRIPPPPPSTTIGASSTVHQQFPVPSSPATSPTVSIRNRTRISLN